jgi:hypothetical protein
VYQHAVRMEDNALARLSRQRPCSVQCTATWPPPSDLHHSTHRPLLPWASAGAGIRYYVTDMLPEDLDLPQTSHRASFRQQVFLCNDEWRVGTDGQQKRTAGTDSKNGQQEWAAGPIGPVGAGSPNSLVAKPLKSRIDRLQVPRRRSAVPVVLFLSTPLRSSSRRGRLGAGSNLILSFFLSPPIPSG